MPRKSRKRREEEIGWITDVQVLDIEPDHILLKRPGVSLTVWKDGRLDVQYESEVLVPQFFMRDVSRTEELQQKWSQSLSDEEWMAWLQHWIEPPPAITYKGGRIVSEWPGGEKTPPRRAATYGLVPDTKGWNDPFFKGARFRFGHFKTKDGEEGLVVQWWDPSAEAFQPPEVYLGDVDDFFGAQTLYDYPGMGPEEWREINQLFDNTAMWALEQMGSFDDPSTVTSPLEEVIEDDPELLLTESLQKMLANISQYRAQMQETILDTAQARRLTL